MKEDYRQLLKPEIINSLKGLSLVSRIVVEGYLSGLNHSRRLGPGMEFSQYRGYEPGDDMRLLDWKMLARSGRYYIKQSEVETHVSVKFIMDATNSMLHQEKGLTKMDFARVLVASLARLAQEQGDAIGLYALNDQDLYALQPKVQKKHFNRLLQELLQIQPEGKWPKHGKVIEQFHNRSRRELLFFISDLHEQNSELTEIISKLKTPRNEVVVLHLLGRDELEFNYKGALTFEDLETGEKMEVDADKARVSYLKSLNASIKSKKESFLSNGISYHLFRLDQPIGEALQLLLKQRKNLV